MTTTTAGDRQSESTLDLFSAEQTSNPYPALKELRELGPAVYMSRYNFWLLTRYDDVRAASKDWKTYTSAKGVGLMDWFNQHLAGSVLASDPPEHDKLRSVLSEKLAPRALGTLIEDVRRKATTLVIDLVDRQEFDVVHDLARVFPINVVADLVGLPEEGRERLHPGADAMFTAFGPETPELTQRLPAIQEYMAYMYEVVGDSKRLAPGSWGAVVVEAAEAGILPADAAASTIGAYMTAGMDTTVNGTASLLRLFAAEPQIWEELRAAPDLAAAAFEEMLRWESPLLGFFRETTCPVDTGDTTVPAGARVLLHLAAANRDPRHYPDPDRFDLKRRPLDHLAFGYGVHSCAGQGLARLEVVALLEALIPRVKAFHLTGEVVRRYNPVVQSWESIPIAVERADA